MSEDRQTDLSDRCCGWVTNLRGKSVLAVWNAYPEMMRDVLKAVFHVKRAAADEFIETACMGNWERFHETSAERCMTAEDYAKMLLDDVFYCSDRWSWDRVIRVQWLYQRINSRCDYGMVGHE